MWDLIVVGAGPAGSTAAKVAAQAGLSVLLVDKARFPRDKPCAGGVSEKSLREVGVALPAGIVQSEITGLIFGGPGGFLARHEAGQRIAVTVRRSDFDSFLVGLALAQGAEFRDGVEVRGLRAGGLRAHGDFIELDLATPGRPVYSPARRGRAQTFDGCGPREAHATGGYAAATGGCVAARFVIGADGAAGRIAALSGLRPRWRRFELGLGAFVEVATGQAPPSAIQLYCLPELACSFGWVFPYRDSVNVGVGASALFPRHFTHVFRSFLQRMQSLWHLGKAGGPPVRYVLPAGGLNRQIAAGRILLAGDAAGLVDPFSGEGIHSAIVSGRMAGEVVARCMASDLAPEQASLEYRRMCQEHFIRQFRMAGIMALMSGYKRAIGFRLIRHDPELAANLARLMTGDGGVYQRLLWWHLRCLPRGLLRLMMRPGKA